MIALERGLVPDSFGPRAMFDEHSLLARRPVVIIERENLGVESRLMTCQAITLDYHEDNRNKIASWQWISILSQHLKLIGVKSTI